MLHGFSLVVPTKTGRWAETEQKLISNLQIFHFTLQFGDFLGAFFTQPAILRLASCIFRWTPQNIVLLLFQLLRLLLVRRGFGIVLAPGMQYELGQNWSAPST